ncbi:hypothetical protein [Thermococcus barossii]|uniref:Uncharacterized protein n=1 Tax=Thermococcus barossii TaxID=54077 RepID=A0A2Z2MTX5_9EURY|nr:hypothetical protein [Thermococcus barossii]ASJ05741.1 hypothetical protein A3L01_10335 [Thermococcus barossii]
MKRAVRWAKTIFMILFILGTITLGHGIARWKVGAPPSTPGPEDVLDAIYNTSSTVVEWEINWTTEDGTTSTRGIVLTESNAITGVSRVTRANGGFRGVKTVRWNGRVAKIRGLTILGNLSLPRYENRTMNFSEVIPLVLPIASVSAAFDLGFGKYTDKVNVTCAGNTCTVTVVRTSKEGGIKGTAVFVGSRLREIKTIITYRDSMEETIVWFSYPGEAGYGERNERLTEEIRKAEELLSLTSMERPI